MKKGYFVSGDFSEGIGFAVVATSEREAKSLVWNADGKDWRREDVECLHLPDANIAGLPIGMVEDSRDALCRGLYDYLREYECDECMLDAEAHNIPVFLKDNLRQHISHQYKLCQEFPEVVV